MEVEQLEYQGTLTSTPHAPVDVMPHPEATPARADRDWRLVRALRLREPTAADRLVATYGDRAYRLAVRITGSEQDAEEAVQVRSGVTRPSDPGSTGSSATPPTRRFADVHRHSSISRSTKFCPHSMRMGVMPACSRTGRRASMTRRCKQNFAPC